MKLTATLSKKVPIPGLEYSSQSFGCTFEAELQNDADENTQLQAMRRLYALAQQSVDEQIADASSQQQNHYVPQRPAPRQQAAPQRTAYANTASRPRWNSRVGTAKSRINGERPKKSAPASQAQLKAIYAIRKANDIHEQELEEFMLDRFGIGHTEDLTVTQASQTIEFLKSVATSH